jgi:hypothetical protein
VEVVWRLWRERIAPVWHAFACAIGDFLDEAAFRVVLAFDVILGRLPLEVEKRYWNRSLETPVLIDVFDWTSERRIFIVLVWPSLESSVEDATSDHRERVRTVKGAIGKGAAEMAWSTRFETDYGLKWDHERQVWAARDGFAYDGSEAGTHDAA